MRLKELRKAPRVAEASRTTCAALWEHHLAVRDRLHALEQSTHALWHESELLRRQSQMLCQEGQARRDS
jgi:hypothetical protein